MAPDIVDQYVLDSPAAAVGIATDRIREEIRAAMLKAQAQVVLGGIRYCHDCIRGNTAASARRGAQQAAWRSRAAHAECCGRPRGRYSLRHRCQ